MKILLGALTYPLPNGVTSSINLSVDGLVKAGDEVRIISPEYPLGQVRPEHLPVASTRLPEVVSRPFGGGERFFGLKATRQIIKQIKEFNPDAYWLHTVSWEPNMFEIIMHSKDKPKVLTYHTMVEFYGWMYAKNLGRIHMRRRSLESANAVDRVIVPTPFVGNYLQSLGVKTPITVIPTPVVAAEQPYSRHELCEQLKIDEEAIVLLSIGRVVREKNIEGLLELLATLKQAQKQAVLVLIGAGNLDHYREAAKKLGVADLIRLTGPMPHDEAIRYYHGADFFVFASKSDTQALTIAEAMLAEVPVLKIENLALEDLYQRKAVVCNNIQEMADRIVQLANDETARTKLVKQAKSFAEAVFSVDVAIQKQRQVFSELAGD